MTTLFFCSLLPERMFDSLRGVSHKVLGHVSKLLRSPKSPLKRGTLTLVPPLFKGG